MRELREWMREKMRRRSKRGPNESESTGKSGQELPTNQLAPLRPDYPEQAPAKTEPPEPVPQIAEPVPQPDVTAEMHGLQPGEAVSPPAPPEPKKIEVEHQ